MEALSVKALNLTSNSLKSICNSNSLHDHSRHIRGSYCKQHIFYVEYFIKNTLLFKFFVFLKVLTVFLFLFLVILFFFGNSFSSISICNSCLLIHYCSHASVVFKICYSICLVWCKTSCILKKFRIFFPLYYLLLLEMQNS